MKKTLIFLAAAVSAVSLYAAPYTYKCNGDFAKVDQKKNIPAGWYKNGKHETATFTMVKEKDGKNVLHLKTTQKVFVALFAGMSISPKAGDKVTVKVVAKGVCNTFGAGFYCYSKKTYLCIQNAGIKLDSPNAYKEYTGSFILTDKNKNLDHVLGNFGLYEPADLWIKSISFEVTPAAEVKK